MNAFYRVHVHRIVFVMALPLIVPIKILPFCQGIYLLIPRLCKLNLLLLKGLASILTFVFRILRNNSIEKIKSEGFFEKLPELQHLDLRDNKISRIEAEAFEGAEKLADL